MPLAITTYILFTLPLFFALFTVQTSELPPLPPYLPFPLPFSYSNPFPNTLFIVLSKISLFVSKVASFVVVPRKLSDFSSSFGFLRVFGGADAPYAPLTGVIFEPFEEVKKDALAVPLTPNVSLARQNYVDESESAINEQIKFFKESSEEERKHAEKLMKYQ
ncbi:hypothetical protein HN51_048348, partial [Arachis hypogaea]